MAVAIHEIEVSPKDPSSERIRRDLEFLGIQGQQVDHARRYVLRGDLGREDVDHLARRLFSHPITEDFSLGETLLPETDGSVRVEVSLKPEVMNPASMNIERGLRSQGFDDVGVTTTDVWRFTGYRPADIENALFSYLANPTIQQRRGEEDLFPATAVYRPTREEVQILELDPDGLMEVSRRGRLVLNGHEMEAIQQYFRERGREPTSTELETLAQTWSEHCVHKTVKSEIEFDYNGKTIHFGNLLDETVMAATRQINAPWCLSVFKDNAGVIAFDSRYGLTFKVETHNHPSAVEPYGGAGTGIGGVIRDTLGTGKGAKPIVSSYVYFVGRTDMQLEEVPKGVFHPRIILGRVNDGVRDYGNEMGIPTPLGGIFEDPSYTGNPLVFCGSVGLIPRRYIRKNVSRGDRIIVMGGRTGRDGIHGVNFASEGLTEQSQVVSSGAVQIGNAIEEKRVTDALLAARDQGYLESVQDCGGGGLSSAVGEMGAKVGVVVDLRKVPLKYLGLKPEEIWISEAQERMVVAVDPKNARRFFRLMEQLDVEATDIGYLSGRKRLELKYGSVPVADLDMEFVHDGLPRITRKAVWRTPDFQEPVIEEKGDYSATLLQMFKLPNLSSKKPFIEQYDRSVQGCRVRDTLAGPRQEGPQDAPVFVPFPGSKKGYAVAMGINPWFGEIDPKEMAKNCVDEALRNLVATGCDLERVALLDNVSMGNADDPEVLGAICLTYMGCKDAAVGYGTPFISGKDSLNNHFEGQRVLHTLVISSLGIVRDVRRTITMDAKQAGNPLYIVGETKPELGASEFYRMMGEMGNSIPVVDNFPARREMMNGLARQIYDGNVVSCHDCSEGGIVAAAAEMGIAAGKGIQISLGEMPARGMNASYQAAFSESPTRFLAEVPLGRRGEFERGMEGYPVAKIGDITSSHVFAVYGLDERRIIDVWMGGLRDASISRYAWRK